MPENIDVARQEAAKIALEAVPDPSLVLGATPQALNELGVLRAWLMERSKLACPKVGEIPFRGSTAKEWLDREARLDLVRKRATGEQQTETGYVSRDLVGSPIDLGTGMECPNCGEWFRLNWSHGEEQFPTLWIDRTPEPISSITSVRIQCPYCDYEEEL